ncbi:MAG: hypothetical protein WAN87_01640 [Thermoplasmata archaeon]
MRYRLPSRRPLLALIILSPGIAEFMTGSTPIDELVYDPLGLAIGILGLLGLYGAGVLLIREITVIWKEGWPTILLLGAAYGILEEGVGFHTFTGSSATAAGALAGYGAFFGINSVWAVGLTLFHALYSIALPILLVGLLYPESKSRRWFDRGALELLALVYGTTVAIGFAVVPYRPGSVALLVELGAITILVLLAHRVSANLLSSAPGPRRAALFWFGFAGAATFIVWLFVDTVGTHRIPPAVLIGLLVGVAVGILWFVRSRTGSIDVEWSQFIFAVGALADLIVWDVLLEFILVPGILFVAGVAVLFLYRLRRKLLTRRSQGTVPEGVAGPPGLGPHAS